jgi:hypothetical protein
MGSRGEALRQRAWLACILAALACAPVLPERSKPGGAARWAQALATDAAVRWARDAVLCRIQGIGVGTEGWLPDRGGSWLLTYTSAAAGARLQVSVDTDGNVTAAPEPAATTAAPCAPLPPDWDDSSRIWAATRAHQKGTPLNTFEAVLAIDAEPERHPAQLVWRIRFFLQGGGYETHVVGATGQWLGSY